MKNTRLKIVEAVADEVSSLPLEQKNLVMAWSQEAKAITDNRSFTKKEKLRALYQLKTSPVINVLLKGILDRAKNRLWDDRSWGARLALGGAAVGVGAAGANFAGIATAGIGLGVPVFLLTASGGALLGTLIDELKKKK